jgi:hypothetical protein
LAVGKIAKKMLGFADEVAQGFNKGIGDAGAIKTVNKIVSNMTPNQQGQAVKHTVQTATRRVQGIANPTMGNRIGDAVGGGIRDTVSGIKSGQKVSEALTNAYTHNGKTRMDRVAGTFVGASAAARVATGGGLYKDRNGSTNIIGLPFL